jgi:uncharacterized cupredoxin-like copper-binding protein
MRNLFGQTFTWPCPDLGSPARHSCAALDHAANEEQTVTSLDPDPRTSVDPSQHVVSDDELDKLLAYDAEQRRREREETRTWMTGLTIGAALLGALALFVSLFALTRGTGTTTKVVAAPATTATPSGGRASTTPTPPAPLGHAVKARLTEMKITDSVAKVAAGKVTFTVTNEGSVAHEYVVLKTSRLAAKLAVSGDRASEAGHVGEIGDLKVGQTKTLTLDLKPGHYSIICNLPGHYLGGMHTDLTVK